MLKTDFAPSRFRIYIVNGVFVSGGMGEDGRVLPPRLFTALAEHLAAETGGRAMALWPYRSKRIFGLLAYLTLTRRSIRSYATFLAASIRDDLEQVPLEPGESLVFVAYSGGVPVAQTAATLLRPVVPVAGFVFFGPALRPAKVPVGWAGDATVGCILGERDWVQGVYPRLPRPWQGALRPKTRARMVRVLPERTVYRTATCNHWPGYFTPEMWPELVSDVCALLPPVAVPG